ncbi:hypothetical protein GCM10022206_76490 [Streptomyces chiangmaiensis]
MNGNKRVFSRQADTVHIARLRQTNYATTAGITVARAPPPSAPPRPDLSPRTRPRHDGRVRDPRQPGRAGAAGPRLRVAA